MTNRVPTIAVSGVKTLRGQSGSSRRNPGGNPTLLLWLTVTLTMLLGAVAGFALLRTAQAAAPNDMPCGVSAFGATETSRPAPVTLPGLPGSRSFRVTMRAATPWQAQLQRTALDLAMSIAGTGVRTPRLSCRNFRGRPVDRSPQPFLKTLKDALAVRAGPVA